MEPQKNGGDDGRMTVRETVYPGGRRRLEAFLHVAGAVIATCDLDCTNEAIGIRTLEAFASVLRQRTSGLTLVPPGTKVV